MSAPNASEKFEDPLCGSVELLRSNRRTLGMSLRRADGPLILRIPLHCTNAEARAFLTANSAWVSRARERLRTREENAGPIAAPDFREGGVFLRLGRPYRLVYANRSEFRDDGTLSVACHSEILAKAQIKKLYQTSSLRYLRNRVRELAARFGFDYESVAVNSATGRWGSCSRGGKLHFSWRLYMCAPELVDYVVLHELSHTVEMNHSPAFWAVLEKCEPRSELLRKKLQEDGRGCPIW